MSRFLPVFLAAALAASASSAASIVPVAYADLTDTVQIDLSPLNAPAVPGATFDSVIDLDGIKIAERFAGQVLGQTGTFDTISGTPTGPLTLVAGAPGANVTVVDLGIDVIVGSGPSGFPNIDAFGEGALSFLFDEDTSRFGFRVAGAGGAGAVPGTLKAEFFSRDGTLLGAIEDTLVDGARLGFATVSGMATIAGVTITNADPEGIGLLDILYDRPAPVPLPMPLALLATAVLGLGIMRRGRQT
ncbi:MAG: hypothetical protein AAFU59_12035 [Pseudomonadota bacterium]